MNIKILWSGKRFDADLSLSMDLDNPASLFIAMHSDMNSIEIAGVHWLDDSISIPDNIDACLAKIDAQYVEEVLRTFKEHTESGRLLS